MNKLLRIDPNWILNRDCDFVKSNKDLEIYLRLCAPNKHRNWGLIDRTGKFQMPLDFQIRLPITNISAELQTYSDACNSRAKEIIDLADQNDLKIYILWSGGVDSTAILTSMLLNSSADQRKRFIVLLTQQSIAENIDYFNNFIIGKLSYASAVNYKNIINIDNILVHGECQDQMYMIMGGRYYNEKEIDNIATTESFHETVLGNSKFDLEIVDAFMFMLRESARSVGVELEKIWEYHWWSTFCFGLQANDVRNFMFIDDVILNPQLLSQNVITFYNSYKFDQFIMQRVQYNKGMPSINSFYKKESKEYIFAFDKNKEYFDKKVKVNSGGVLQSTFKKKSIMDNSFNDVPIERLMDYYNPNNYFSKYQ
jgi:hypothetical protein